MYTPPSPGNSTPYEDEQDHYMRYVPSNQPVAPGNPPTPARPSPYRPPQMDRSDADTNDESKF